MQKEKINFVVAIIATLTAYVFMELMFKHLYFSSIANPFVYQGITSFQAVSILTGLLISLIFAVGCWIDTIKFLNS